MHSYVFTKNPLSTLDYTIDWEDWLEGDTLSTSTWTLPSGVTLLTSVFTATTATAWVSGGSSDTNYILANAITTAGGRTEVGSVTLIVKSSSNLRYLIPFVRLKIGDTDSANHRFIDDWILKSLAGALSKSGRWLNYKYLLDNDNNVYRNPNGTFIIPEPPIIEAADEDIIVTMSAIILLEGTLANSAYDVASWRDAEIAFSNLEGARTRKDLIQTLRDELTETLLPPVKRLKKPTKQHLPGYMGNPYEVGNIN